MRLLSLLFAAVLIVANASAWADPLTVLYFERPPYYFTHEGQAAGFLMSVADNVLRKAGFTPHYQALPPNRILAQMQEGSPVCSVGWFKNPVREAYARFSVPIYRNRPLVVLYLWNDTGKFKDVATVADLFSRRDLVWGTVAGFSYGDHVEGLRRELQPRVLPSRVSQGQLLGMLALGRFDYLLLSPEELDALAQTGEAMAGTLSPPEPDNETVRTGASIQHGDFAALSLRDMPPASPRRIMCAKTVDPSVIERLNKAIVETLGHVE